MDDSTTSKVRTDKLYCTDCKKKIKKGELAEFLFTCGCFSGVLCSECGDIDYEYDRHPFDLDEWPGV